MPLLHVIQSLTDPLCSLITDDPVRPEIPLEFRVSTSSEIFVLLDELDLIPMAAVCCAYRDSIPKNTADLILQPLSASVAVFYTIWSYQPGGGRSLIVAARRWIQANRAEINQFVTLSPPTDMARVFHLRNGAEVFRVNSDTVNYLYP
jgi:hypothetical protein